MYLECMVEKVCPLCKKNFFPQAKVVSKRFCGEELICSPPEEDYKSPDCQSYDFCSSSCLEDFTSRLPTCSYVPGWKRLMNRINRVGTESGIAGTRPHNLPKSCK
jgi:hypothetical protein